jgi:AcrR family transcriptional regulator
MAGMVRPTGLRERKKLQTRQQIFEAASRLFQEHGFDAVTVAEVAREADVSEVTVFNYFPTKEDLFFAGMEFFEEELLRAVRERSPGQSALAAFRRRLLDSSARLADEEAAKQIAKSARTIAASPSLRTRELETVARYTGLLRENLAEEVGEPAGDVESMGVASALMGVHRTLVAHVRGRVLAGARGRQLEADFRKQTRRLFDRLEHGLGGYAVKASSSGSSSS